MRLHLLPTLLFVLALLFTVTPDTFAQINQGNFARDNVEVTFDGTGGGEGSIRYNYLVKEIQVDNGPNGKGNSSYAPEDLELLVISLCGDLLTSDLYSWSPEYTDPGILAVTIPATAAGVTGIGWTTAPDFDSDSFPAGDEGDFSILVSDSYDEGLIAVGIKTFSGDTYIRYIPGPVCADCKDARLIPSWDALTDPITSDGAGNATLVLNAPHGLKNIQLAAPSSNIALVEARDPVTDTVLDFAAVDALAGSKNSGFSRLEFFGTPDTAPTEVELHITALEEAPSSFYLEFTDCCAQTARVDPVLELFDTATANEAEGTLPAAFELQQNYPNPFNPETVLHFALPEAAQVRLAVYDLLGREVQVLVSGNLPAGTHAVTWNGRDASGSEAASGVYLYRLEAGPFMQTRHMTLLR